MIGEYEECVEFYVSSQIKSLDGSLEETSTLIEMYFGTIIYWHES